MKRRVMCLCVFVLVGMGSVASVEAAPVFVENASFEAPPVDPNAFPALPFVDGWTELDLDMLGSTNTGVFGNTPEGSADRIMNADANQLAFLGSETGNALEQDLDATYVAGCDYRLTVGVAVSSRFAPSAVEPVDTLELVLYYHDANEVVDIARQTVSAVGMSSTQLQDFSLYLPTVQADDAWAGQPIGLAIRAMGLPGGFWDLDNVRLMELLPLSVSVENASFEAPPVDPNAFPALPFADGWTEFDVDTLGSTNTGVFANTPEGSPDRMANAHGSQMAFLGSELGNGFEQDLPAVYVAGADYRLTVGVGVSWRFPPSAIEPIDTLELVLYYRDANDVVDIAQLTVEPSGLTSTQLQDFAIYLPTVQPDDAWAGQPIGLAIRAVGLPGGFWDLDDVRLTELLPMTEDVNNGSFEAPPVDPNAFPALPFADGWTELDVDALGSTNTGVFANTPEGSPDRMANAHGNQMAFLGSELGNGFEQDLSAAYVVGADYRLTVAVGVSWRFPPSSVEPTDTLELVLYYRDANDVVDIAQLTVEPSGLTSTQLQDFSLYLPTVQADDAWAGQPVGLAIRAVGLPGGFWDLDDVRLVRSLPVEESTAIQEE